jgi:hypothetical protein
MMACAAVLALLRVTVLVSEAYALIVSERRSEMEFVQLCNEGRASRSVHMREACMHATVENSGFVIFRALSRGCYDFFAELYQFACAPFRAGAWFGALSLVSLLPWVSTLKALCWPGAASSASGDSASAQRVLVLSNGASATEWNGDEDDIGGYSMRRRRVPMAKLAMAASDSESDDDQTALQYKFA